MSYYKSYNQTRKPWVMGLSNFIYNNTSYKNDSNINKRNNYYNSNYEDEDNIINLNFEQEQDNGFTDIYYKYNSGSNLCFVNSSI